jgi:hypothetical protein
VTIAESFIAVAVDVFSFLETEHGLARKQEAYGASWYGVVYRSHNVIVQFFLESDAFVEAELVPLVNGEKPPRFDPDLHEHRTNLPLTDVIGLLDPAWQMPAASPVRNEGEIAEVLAAYARALRRYAKQILDPDPAFLERVRTHVSRRTLLRLLQYWATFVQEVRDGYGHGLSSYVSSISGRATLEDMTDWNDPFTKESRRQLLQLDDLFDEATDPLPWGLGQFVPTPRAARWWRKPRRMSTELREDFSRFGPAGKS